jgi:hypothetical protein
LEKVGIERDVWVSLGSVSSRNGVEHFVPVNRSATPVFEVLFADVEAGACRCVCAPISLRLKIEIACSKAH